MIHSVVYFEQVRFIWSVHYTTVSQNSVKLTVSAFLFLGHHQALYQVYK
jgi:hypothetical protein